MINMIFCFAWCNLKMLIIPYNFKCNDNNIADCQRSCLSQSLEICFAILNVPIKILFGANIFNPG